MARIEPWNGDICELEVDTVVNDPSSPSIAASSDGDGPIWHGIA